MNRSIKDVVGYLPCCESGECHRGCPDYEPTDAELGGAVTDLYDSPSYDQLNYSRSTE